MTSQAEKIIARFGNANRLAMAIERLGNPEWTRNRTSINRWVYPRHKGGCDGLIPTRARTIVALAARHEGIFLTAEDWQE